jgi:hypothetical protein
MGHVKVSFLMGYRRLFGNHVGNQDYGKLSSLNKQQCDVQRQDNSDLYYKVTNITDRWGTLA